MNWGMCYAQAFFHRSNALRSLPELSADMLGRRAMVLQETQTERYFPALQARGWSVKPGEPSATLEKHFNFGTEDQLAGWTAEVLAYMQRANVRSLYSLMR